LYRRLGGGHVLEQFLDIAFTDDLIRHDRQGKGFDDLQFLLAGALAVSHFRVSPKKILCPAGWIRCTRSSPHCWRRDRGYPGWCFQDWPRWRRPPPPRRLAFVRYPGIGQRI